jgi:hypothetical protein
MGDANRFNASTAFNRWRDFAKTERIKARFFNGLHKTTFGKLLLAFNKWKYLPNKKKDTQEKASLLIGNKIQQMLLNRYKSGFDPIKEIWWEKENIKRRAVRDILYSTVQKHRLAFNKWLEYTRTLKALETCKKVVRFTDAFKAALTTNVTPLYTKSDVLDRKRTAIL